MVETKRHYKKDKTYPGTKTRASKSRHKGKTDKNSPKKSTKKKADAYSYVKVGRLGKVSIYRRNKSYWLYFRDSGKSIRKKIDGNLATARATASQVNVYLEQKRPSPFSFDTRPINQVMDDYIDHCRLAKGLRVRTLERYKAALGHFREFLKTKPSLRNIDQVKETTVDEFVKYMHGKQRVRSGEKKGPKGNYTPSGIAFILSTCRTLFNYARKRRLLSPYEDNPFSNFPIEKLRSREPSSVKVLASEQLTNFFTSCDDWQFSIFFILSLYGLRVGELVHLLITDVEFAEDRFFIRSKPFMQWYTKTNRELTLPIIPAVKPIFKELVGKRKEGFVFLSRAHRTEMKETPSFSSRTELENYISFQVDEFKKEGKDKTDLQIFNYIRRILHKVGKIREDRVREEFMQVSDQVGRPEVTSVHSLRHLFATLAEENGLNPLTVQTILGHSRLEMTRYYTHTGLEAKKNALEDFLQGKGRLDQVLEKRMN